MKLNTKTNKNMDTQTNTTLPEQVPQPVIGSNMPSPVPPSWVRRAVDKIMLVFKFIKAKFYNISDSVGGVSSSVTEISQRTKKIATSVAALFLLLVTFAIVLTYIKNRSKMVSQEEKKDDGMATTIVERKPSRYASDETVLRIETDVKALESEIGTSEIEEKNLTPPSLNFDINFKE